MEKRVQLILRLGILTAGFLTTASGNPETTKSLMLTQGSDYQLKKAAFEILDTKCNVCHRKKIPFMVFNTKNMTRRAPKIYRMVFVDRRMPKGDDVRLTNEEYFKLEKWLFTQNIY